MDKISNEELVIKYYKSILDLLKDPDETNLIRYTRELLSRLKRGEKYKLFFESCSCLFAEGVEFMTKTEIYEAIKKEVKKLEGDQ